ncbi:MFS transporter [Lichenicola sp.]|uniref:MFS transporter n=1 Tax=Lichenicola sp. TaxID=2804529 RepID=UPI003B00093E
MRPFLGLLGILIAAIGSEFNDQVTSIALGDVTGGLGLSHDPGTWFESLYVSAEVVGMALSPWLLVTFSLRQFALFVLLLNAVSSAMIPFSPDASALYILRIVQGLSGGFTIPLLMTTALRVLNPPIRLYGLALYALTATFTPALASTMAALWTDLVGWRFVFLSSIPICAAAATLAWYGIPQDPQRFERFRIFDWRGALLLVVGMGSFTTMLQQGDRFDWFNSPLICVLGLTSVVAIPLLLVNEWFHELPLLKLQLLGRRNLAYGGICLFLFLLIGQSAGTVPNAFLGQVQGYRPEQFYLVTLAIAAPQLVLLPAVSWVLEHPSIDVRLVNFAGLAMILASCIGLSFATIDWYRGPFFFWLALQTVGQPMVVVSLLMMATNTVKGPQEAPFASAIVNTPRAISEAVGIWLVQLIERWRGGLHYNRLVDQVGQDRYRLIQAPQITPQHPPPLLPNGQPSSPGSLQAFAQAIEQQARILTISDMFLVFAGITAVLMVVLVLLTEYTLPPRLLFAKK